MDGWDFPKNTQKKTSPRTFYCAQVTTKRNQGKQVEKTVKTTNDKAGNMSKKVNTEEV